MTNFNNNRIDRVITLSLATMICLVACSDSDKPSAPVSNVQVIEPITVPPQPSVMSEVPTSTVTATSGPTPSTTQITAPAIPIIESPYAWAEVLEMNPDPAVVTNPELLQRIAATGLPWRIRDKASEIELLLVPPGSFMMGASGQDKESQKSEMPAHEVKLTKPFYLGRTEVTQLQWELIMNNNPSAIFGRNVPVHRVAIHELETFAQKTHFRLPTEAEWEYACRAGTSAPRYGELEAIAWDSANAKSPMPVSQKNANALGFYDMLGNVQEWCADFYGRDYYAQCGASVNDPTGPATGKFRVSRGGSWASIDKACRAPYRFAIEADYRGEFTGDGFRVAMSP